MKEQRNFIKIVKRFFLPVYAYKKMTALAIIPAFVNSIVVILSVYLIKEITNKLQDGLSLDVKILIIYFILLVLLHYIVLIFFRRKTYVIMWPTFRKYMYKTYIKKFIYLDNNQAEKHWTWKLIALIDKWMHACSCWFTCKIFFRCNMMNYNYNFIYYIYRIYKYNLCFCNNMSFYNYVYNNSSYTKENYGL